MATPQMNLRVTLTDGAVHDVDVIFGDLLRGELEASKQGIDERHGLHMATVYAWCAMQRTHVLDSSTPYAVFKEALLDAVDIVEVTETDPTTAAPSASPAT